MKTLPRKTSAKDIDTYLAGLPSEAKVKLDKLRQTIKNAAPKAEEVISYQMPAFRFYGMLVWFAAFKNHYSLFVRPKVLQLFEDELKQYETSKSAVRIPLDQPVPVRLVTKIVRSAVKENILHAQLKSKK